MRHLPLILSLILPLPALAQDRAGNDTPGEWVVDHTARIGLWDSICDYRVTGDLREERCYIRYVDVFSPHPEFGAVFLFVTPEPKLEIGVEPGTVFAPEGIRIERDGETIWADAGVGCIVGLDCTFTDGDALALLAQLGEGDTLAMDFTDRHSKEQALRWDLTRFDEVFADYQAGVAERGL